MEYMESKMQEQYDSQNELIKELDELRNERDALSAQVEVCNSALKGLLKTPLGIGGSLQSDGQFYYKVAESVFKKAESALSATPQQCLRDVQAEAGRAGYLEGVRQMVENEIGMLGHDANSCANHYAAKVRKGGE